MQNILRDTKLISLGYIDKHINFGDTTIVANSTVILKIKNYRVKEKKSTNILIDRTLSLIGARATGI